MSSKPPEYGAAVTASSAKRPRPPGARTLSTRGDQRHYLEPRAICVVRRGQERVYLPIYVDHAYTFGRSSEATVVFPDDTVSRVHGRLSYRGDGRWVYRDLGSRNGSFLSELLFEDPSERRQPLQPSLDFEVSAGQSVQLGNGGRIAFLAELPDELRKQREGTRRSPAMRRLEQAVLEAALLPPTVPIVLLGPTGSGKSFHARRIHELSGVNGPFEAVNCGALSSDAATLQSELLGHVPGAFTHAIKKRLGKVWHANGGTLFLDEVESMPPEAQRFFLDLLDGNASYAPLGAPAAEVAEKPRFRLIAASKIPLTDSKLRRDLCQRLGRGTHIRVPTLEERKEDVPAFVETFIKKFKDEQHLDVRFSPDAVAYLQAQSWPGHVRELEGVVFTVAHKACTRRRLERSPESFRKMDTGLFDMAEIRRAMANPAEESAEPLNVSLELVREHLEERSVVFGALPITEVPVTAFLPRPEGRISTERRPEDRPSLPQLRRPKDLSREELTQVLEAHGWNFKHTADALGVVVNTLKAHMERLGIARVKPEAPPSSSTSGS